jgi:hypothetical protein
MGAADCCAEWEDDICEDLAAHCFHLFDVICWFLSHIYAELKSRNQELKIKLSYESILEWEDGG